ncbi:MAG: DNA translocase FtsK, partial [Lachnospiraceae bacterium]
LLGKGDMLFSPQGAPRPMRVQGAFVSDQEVQKVVEYIKEEELPLSYSKETVEKIVRSADSTAQTPGSGRDELFAQAGQFIIDRQKASIGNLQRMFKIGFNRAARIMDQLSEAGVVGEEQGTKPREVLMTVEQFEELLRQSE